MPARKKALPVHTQTFPKPIQRKIEQYHYFLAIFLELRVNIKKLRKILPMQDPPNQQRIQREIQMLEQKRTEFKQRIRQTSKGLPRIARLWLAAQLRQLRKK